MKEVRSELAFSLLSCLDAYPCVCVREAVRTTYPQIYDCALITTLHQTCLSLAIFVSPLPPLLLPLTLMAILLFSQWSLLSGWVFREQGADVPCVVVGNER